LPLGKLLFPEPKGVSPQINAMLETPDPRTSFDLLLGQQSDCSVRVFSASSSRFTDVLRLRSEQLSGEPTDCTDAWSYHYGVLVEDNLVAAMRVTQARFGFFDCQENYPTSLFERFLPMIASATRLCSDPNTKALGHVRTLFSLSWRHNHEEGMMINIINAKKKYRAYYERMGFQILSGWEFSHPRTQQLHDVYYLVGSKAMNRYFGSIFFTAPEVSAYYSSFIESLARS
jgi:hypothetical protein